MKHVFLRNPNQETNPMSDCLRLDPELASRAEALFHELGLDLSTAVQLFLLQSLRERGLPFTPRLSAPAAPEQTPSSAEPSEPMPADRGILRSDRDDPADESDPSHVLEDDGEEENDSSVLCTGDAPEPERPLPDKTSGGRGESRPNDASPSAVGALQDADDELRQAFLNARLIGTPLRRVRSLNRLYGMGEPNSTVPGWREVYVSGDEPFALDFGVIRVELGFYGGGSLRMMDGRLPDSVLEADAVYPRDLSPVFSSVIGQPLADVSSTGMLRDGRRQEQLSLHFANGCTLHFTPGGDWGALWLTDARGSVMFAPETVWLRVLGDKTWNGLRRMDS